MGYLSKAAAKYALEERLVNLGDVTILDCYQVVCVEFLRVGGGYLLGPDTAELLIYSSPKSNATFDDD
jgi:hypothetical protein